MDRKKIQEILKSGYVFYLSKKGPTYRQDIARFLGKRSINGIKRYNSPDDLKGFREPVVVLWTGFESYGPKRIKEMAHNVHIYNGVILDGSLKDVTKKMLSVYRKKPEEVIVRRLLREDNDFSRFINLYKSWRIFLDPLPARVGPEHKSFFIYVYLEEGEDFEGTLGACSRISFYSNGGFRQQEFLDCKEETV